MREGVWLVSALATAVLWSGQAAAEPGCPYFNDCQAPTSTYSNYVERRTGYVVRYRTVRAPAPAVYGYRAGRIAPAPALRRPYRVYYQTTVELSAYSSAWAGPSVPSTRD